MQCGQGNNCWKWVVVMLIIALSFLTYKTIRGNEIIQVSKAIDNNPSKEELNSAIREYILSNPEIIIESIELMHQRKLKEMEDKIQNTIIQKRSEIENAPDLPHAGNKDGDVKVIMFYDYMCSYCKKSNDILNNALKSDQNLKVVYIPIPMLGEASEYVSKLMLSINKVAPDKFKAVHDEIMSTQNISKESINAAVEKNGLNLADIEIEMSKPEIKATYNKNYSLAHELRINGAPAFIINGELRAGMIELEQMQKIVSDKRALLSNQDAPKNDKSDDLNSKQQGQQITSEDQHLESK
jgi:protein-disulfide isomerase